MPCTTILVGKNASYNGSTMISRNDDSGSGKFTPKHLKYIFPKDQPKVYHSVISQVEIPLPENPMGYTAFPNADPSKEGIWAAGGINEKNVGMTATETITSNSRVLGADPLCEEGIGEEDIVVLVLPYINSAREGVIRLGKLLEEYGTYESNGIAFNDHDEVWYMETIGGHHWIARRLPDDSYSVIANQFSLDAFDLEDALNEQKDYMASADLLSFIEENHLDLNRKGHFNARLAFGSHTATDHIYNTCRVWYGQRYFNPNEKWNKISLESDDLPWCRVPESLITISDVKTVLSSVYEGTPYDPYTNNEHTAIYRPIGINRTDLCQLMEIRNNVPEEIAGILWFAFASNVYNALIPQYAQAKAFSWWFETTPEEVSTDSYYWTARMIAAMADPSHSSLANVLDSYKLTVGSKSRHIMDQYEKHGLISLEDLARANETIADMVRKQTIGLLGKVLYISSMKMKNAFSLSDN